MEVKLSPEAQKDINKLDKVIQKRLIKKLQDIQNNKAKIRPLKEYLKK